MTPTPPFQRPSRRVLLGAGAAFLAPGLARAAPPASDPNPWIAYEARLRARMADAGGGRFDDAAARAVLTLTNAARQAAGAGPLAWHPELAEAARAHAGDLVQRGYIEHLSPETFDPSHRFWLLGRRTVGSPSENIAWHKGGDPATPQRMMKIWQGSPGHWKNLLRPSHTHAAFGFVRRGDQAWVVGLYANPLARLVEPLPFRLEGFDQAAQVIKGFEALPPGCLPRVTAPQGADAGRSPRPGEGPRLMQLSLRRRMDETSFELIGGPIFLLGQA